MINQNQLRLVHIAARQIKLIDGKSDERYRLLLHNVAGVDSASKLDNTTFEDVMAVMEDIGFSFARQRQIDRGSFFAAKGGVQQPSTYWRDKVGNRGHFANARMVHKINELVAESRYELPALCHLHSNHRVNDPTKLTPREAWNLIEMLKASAAREAAAVDKIAH